jgi:uncharacterized protein (TIGR02001 family)
MWSDKRRGSCCRAVLALGLLVPSLAGAAPRWHGSIGASSDYVWRGVSRTLGDPAAQASLNVSAPSGWYAGVWASMADQHARYEIARYEVDVFAGYRQEISDDWLLDVGVVRYSHPDDPRTLEYDYTEVTATLSFAGRASLLVAVSPDTSMYTSRGPAVEETAAVLEMSLAQPIFKHVSLTGGIGYYHLDELFSTGYMYWNAGFAVEVGRVAVDVTHIEVDDRGRELFGAEIAGPRTVVSLIVAF